MSNKWIRVGKQLDGCHFVQEHDAFLVERAQYLCREEWETWSDERLLGQMANLSSLTFDGATLVSMPNETFYVPWDTLAAQL